MPSKQLLMLPVVAVLSALAGVLVFYVTQNEPAIVSAPPSSPARQLSFDELSFAGLDGGSYRLADWNERILVINFWAPWCAPCRREIPALIELQQQHAGHVRFIGLAFDTAANVSEFARQYDFNYPLLLVQKDTAAINALFGNRSGGLPFTVILDASRTITFSHAGEISANALNAAITAQPH
jgi:thiol-disulfide isomerase/thioredoxin